MTEPDELSALRQALADAQRRLQAVVEVSGGPLGTLEFELRADGALVLIRSDDVAQQLISVAAPSFYGKRILEVFTGMTGTDLPDVLAATAREGRPMSTRQFVPPGTRLGRAFSMFAFQAAPGRVVLKFWESSGLAETQEIGRRNQELLAQVFRDSPMAIALVREREGVIVDVNSEWSRLTGWPRQEALGHTTAELGLWQDATARAQALDALRHQGMVRNVELHLRARDGADLVISVHAARIDIGTVPHHLVYLLDVTPQRHAEALLREREAVLLQAQRLAQVGSWRWNSATGESQWSDETYRAFGVDPATFVVNLENFMALVHPDDRSTITQAHADALAGARPYDIEYRVLAPGGEVRRLHGRASVVPGDLAGRPTTMLGTVLDITQRKASEQALRLRDEALRTSLNAIAMSDMQGRLSYVNDAFMQLWGLSAEHEAIGEPVEAFWEDPAQAREVVGALIGGAGTWRGELVGRRRDGSTFDVALWASLAAGSSGEPIGLLSSFLDITERKRAEADLQLLNATLEARVQARTRELEVALSGLRQAQDELVRTEKMTSLGSLVAGVAHELNTPIGNAVMVASTLSGRQLEFEAGMAGGLRRSALDGFLASTREVSEVLQRNLQRAAELIGSFKQLAVDQSSHQRRPFELSEVVKEIALALSPVLRRSGVTLVDETPAALRMDSYPGPLGQVFINLVNNAIMHGFEGRAAGRVRIRAERVAPDRVRVSVDDDGCGIGSEHLKQVFDPFFTTKLGQGGSGLGLHVVYTLVTGLLGGRIEVHSAPGQGTEFVIELPRIAPTAGVNEMSLTS